MRATILLTAMLAAGLATAESLPEGDAVNVTTPAEASPVAPADAAPVGDAVVTAAPADAACNCPAEGAPINLGAAPEPETVVTIAPTSTAGSAGGFGAGTRSWVDLQVSGSAASTIARPLPGEAATNVYERYANSFKQPIPAKFDRESFATDGGGN
jgi:hypothetical protein